jgi:hypothetical protein
LRWSGCPRPVVWVRLRGHADANFLVRLGAFRDQLHACFPRRADGLMDLGDALLCAGRSRRCHT